MGVSRWPRPLTSWSCIAFGPSMVDPAASNLTLPEDMNGTNWLSRARAPSHSPPSLLHSIDPFHSRKWQWHEHDLAILGWPAGSLPPFLLSHSKFSSSPSASPFSCSPPSRRCWTTAGRRAGRDAEGSSSFFLARGIDQPTNPFH
jgi:hypothetical protein